MNPWFVTGFMDGEGCFHVSIIKNNKSKVGYYVKHSFQIGLHEKDKSFLEDIKNFLGVGTISKHGSESFQLKVESIKDIKKLVDFLEKYPMITEGCSDFQLFKKAFHIIELKEHLTPEGLRKIVAIKALMNRGLSPELKLAFPEVVAVIRPAVTNKKIPNSEWAAGFTSAEGCFKIIIFQATTKIGETVQLVFQLNQHIRDKQLIKNLIKYFDCGNINYEGNVIIYTVTNIDDITQNIIPFFFKYKIQGVKAKDFADWCKAAELINEKKHLTKEGLEKIKQIKAGINTGRNN